MMQTARKHWENLTSHIYPDFSVMTFGFTSDNIIHLVAENLPLLSGVTGQHIGLFSDY